MSDTTPQQTQEPREHWSWKWYLPVAITFVAAVIGLMAGSKLPLLLGAILVGFGGLAILRWPDLAALAVIGLVYSNLPVVAVQFHGAPGALPAAVLAMLFWPLFYRIVVRREAIQFLPGLPWAFAYTVVLAAGALLSDSPGEAAKNFIAFLLEGLAVYLIVTNVVRTRRSLHATLWVLALCGVLMGGAPLAKQMTGSLESEFAGLAQSDSQFRAGETASEGVVRQGRASGTIGEQNRYAQFMLMLVPVGLALVSFETNPKWKLLAVAATLLALLGAALAFSRGAAVGCVLAIVIAAALKIIDRRQLKFMVIAGCLALCLLPQYLTRLSSLGSVATSTFSGNAGNHEDGAVRGRLTEMGAAALVFRDHLLVGVGPGMFTAYSREYGQIIGLRPLDRARESHSLPLGIAAENGILGLFAFAGVLLVVGRRLLRARHHAASADDRLGVQVTTAMLLVGIIFLCTGLFLHMAYIRYFWMLLGIADAAGQIVMYGDQGADFLPTGEVPQSGSELVPSLPASSL